MAVFFCNKEVSDKSNVRERGGNVKASYPHLCLCLQIRRKVRYFMKYSIRANEVKGNEGNLRGFATVVFGDSFKISNIAILESNEGKLFVSMPRYKSNEKGENGAVVYKDVCNPITKEFHDELYDNILEAFDKAKGQEKAEGKKMDDCTEMPSFSVSVTPYEREGSNIRGLARIYFEDNFVVNNVSILQGKEDSLFVAMPSYRTKQVNDSNKPIYQDVCYPVTKEFRERLYGELILSYQKVKDEVKTQVQEQAQSVPGQSQPNREAAFR